MNMNTDEMDAMGKELANEYRGGTLFSKSHVNGLKYVYKEKSKYLFMQYGQSDYNTVKV